MMEWEDIPPLSDTEYKTAIVEYLSACWSLGGGAEERRLRAIVEAEDERRSHPENDIERARRKRQGKP